VLAKLLLEELNSSVLLLRVLEGKVFQCNSYGHLRIKALALSSKGGNIPDYPSAFVKLKKELCSLKDEIHLNIGVVFGTLKLHL